jgi:lipopolysaccharide export system protein LptA
MRSSAFFQRRGFLRSALARPALPRPIMARAVALGAATVLAVLSGSAATLAQKNPQSPAPPNALQGFSQNRGQPVKIQSERLVVRDEDKVATFSGNVHVTQGDTDMRSKDLVVYYIDNANAAGAPAPAMTATVGSGEQQKIRRIVATGGVTVTQKDQNATGDTGTFDMQSNSVTLSGNVVVTHGKDVVRSQRLIVDLTTGVSHMEGGVTALFGSAPNGEIALPGPGGPAGPGTAPRPARAN